ncbi:MAG: universal stress protein [Labrys sp. (in: a-proteobacteria)]
MAFKSICHAAIHDTTINSGAAKGAVDIAARLKAHLTVALGVPFVFSPVLYPSAALATIEVEVNQREKQRIDGLADALRSQAQLAGVTVETHVLQDALYGLYDSLSGLTRTSDLVVTAAPGDSDGAMREFVEELVRTSGGPVITVPDNVDLSKGFGRIMLAWDGGMEASRAMRHAMPFLAAADTVEIVTVTGDDTDARKPANLNLAAAHLARHCRKVVETSLKTVGSVQQTLANHAGEGRQDLIVMGFYGHTRLREWALGGATRDMLRFATMPVLFAA